MKASPPPSIQTSGSPTDALTLPAQLGRVTTDPKAQVGEDPVSYQMNNFYSYMDGRGLNSWQKKQISTSVPVQLKEYFKADGTVTDKEATTNAVRVYPLSAEGFFNDVANKLPPDHPFRMAKANLLLVPLIRGTTEERDASYYLAVHRLGGSSFSPRGEVPPAEREGFVKLVAALSPPSRGSAESKVGFTPAGSPPQR